MSYYHVNFSNGSRPIEVKSISIVFFFGFDEVSRTIPHGETPFLSNQPFELRGNCQVVFVDFTIGDFFVIFRTR